MADPIEYRLALILPGTGEVLAALDNGTSTLPRIAIRPGERHVKQLTELIRQTWGIRAVVLDLLAGAEAVSPWAVLEVRQWSEVPGSTLGPVHIDSTGRSPLSEAERDRLISFLGKTGPRRNIFMSVGWLGEVQRWITDSGHALSSDFSNDVLQLNAGGGFALARVGTTNGSAFWLKAVGPPNEHEFGITKALAECLPSYLPSIVAMRDEWNAWITEDAGHPLSETFTLPSVRRVVATLANLQIDSIEHRDALRAAGCIDISIPVLKAHLREIREYLEETMARQTSRKVAPLGTFRLRELEQILREACSRMQELCIPDALLHNDINAGNILLSDSRCFFIDWAEGQIGNPFLTFQHICAQILREVQDADTWLPAVKRSYREPWLTCLSESQIEQAYALMPILAIASYLYGRGSWLCSSDRDNPHFQAHARSLARYIDRAARAPELEEALCH
ncbi:hypothetical protein ACPOL_6320 [Acidisarcina polymorpha]|uniref:Aminoglycoside phosphotransferase domain-containing protein n=1 Tax=Acidisarcina polymorpha TaxID=2211140 RepID=A0A2Z5GA18_9BACT|nr:phosphotransferase [Acidisarcina polymorpha]AXC15554.1 hypothetical protein ACPOL_6320 [Acidisarcina polymorpha]